MIRTDCSTRTTCSGSSARSSSSAALRRRATSSSACSIERGRALGKKLASRQDGPSFEHAVRAFVTASARTRTPAALVRLEARRAEVTGSACPLGLEGRGIEICRTAMTMDQGILEAASGERIRVTVLESLAAGDQGCRVVFEVET